MQRLESFDGSEDYRTSRDELPECMQGLVARDDRNGDAALDSNEIRDLVYAESSHFTRASSGSQRSEGLPGVIKELKLPAAKHADALAIVTAHRLFRTFNDPTGRSLYTKLRAVLDDEEYGNFVAASARLSRSRP